MWKDFTEAKLTAILSHIVGCISVQYLSPQELYRIIGGNVAKYRKEKGFSQLDLSLKMGYKSVSVVSGAEICYGDKHFNIEQLLKISQILEVELCDFLRKEE